MFCTTSSSPTLTGVTFADNTATAHHVPLQGGGLFCEELSSPRLTDCSFTGNVAGYGGGLLCRSGSPVLERVVFDSNEGAYSGAGMACADATVTLVDVVFSGNRSASIEGPGGALAMSAYASARLTRVTFVGNLGGAALFSECSPTVTSCTKETTAPCHARRMCRGSVRHQWKHLRRSAFLRPRERGLHPPREFAMCAVPTAQRRMRSHRCLPRGLWSADR